MIDAATNSAIEDHPRLRRNRPVPPARIALPIRDIDEGDTSRPRTEAVAAEIGNKPITRPTTA
jgi:hypothetical protein